MSTLTDFSVFIYLSVVPVASKAIEIFVHCYGSSIACTIPVKWLLHKILKSGPCWIKTLSTKYCITSLLDMLHNSSSRRQKVTKYHIDAGCQMVMQQFPLLL